MVKIRKNLGILKLGKKLNLTEKRNSIPGE